MMQYEYSTVIWEAESGVPLTSILNRQGEDGWVFQTSIARNLVFMRPVPYKCVASPLKEHIRRINEREQLKSMGIDYDKEKEAMAKEALAKNMGGCPTKPEPFQVGSGLPFNAKYPATGIRDDKGNGPNKRVCDALELLEIRTVGQLVELDGANLDGLRNCGTGTKDRILAMRDWAAGRLV